jgi:hypothetical protein
MLARSLVAVSMMLAITSCKGCDEPDFEVVAPAIDIGDPFAEDRSICEREDGNGDYRVVDCKHDFGEVALGRSNALTFTIRNPSGVRLNVRGISWEEGSDLAFDIEGGADGGDIQSGDDMTITVVFRPELSSTLQGVLLIDSDAENRAIEGGFEPVRIELTGTGGARCAGVPVIAPQECACGQVGVGAAATCVVNISNEGDCPFLITDVAFSPDTDEDVFGIRGFFQAPTEIGAGSAVSITLYCEPSTQATYTGELLLQVDDSEELTSIPLSVEGANTPTAVARVQSVNGTPTTSSDVQPLDDVVLTGIDSSPGTAGGNIVAYRWEIISAASGSDVRLDSPTDMTTRFLFGGNRYGLDAAGTYIVGLTVTDNLGATSSNEARVVLNATPRQGLVVQVTWDSSSDIDLHLNRGSTGSGWCTEDDCNWENECKACQNGGRTPFCGGLEWSGNGTNDDPVLDIDDINGFGPENINIDNPADGAYTIAATYFGGDGGATNATVKVFSGGELIGEYFGELDGPGVHWQPARITVAGGVVTVTDVDSYATQSGQCLSRP